VNVYVVVRVAKKGEGREKLEMVAYHRFGHVPSRFQGWSNVINNLPRPAMGESLMMEDTSANFRTQIRFEQ
jgi:hypothetical protein